MSRRAHGQVRRSQVITTYGPGALIDLPKDAAIVGGLETWTATSELERIDEPRLARKIQVMTGVKVPPSLFSPPPDSSDPRESKKGIGAWRFPEWFVVQEEAGGRGQRERSRRLVHRKILDERGRFDGQKVVPTRFVRGCPRGHVDDLDWRQYVHGPGHKCFQQLWLDERGTSGDLTDLVVRCECQASRQMHEATIYENNPLGFCTGRRPWLGNHSKEDCAIHSRLLIRTAANAYFPQVVSALSLPNRRSAVEAVVAELWDDLQIVTDLATLEVLKRKPRVAQKLAPFDDEEVLAAIRAAKDGSVAERPVKQVELDAILAAPSGYGEDVPIDPDFHARRLPDAAWRRTDRNASVQAVIQLHRLREVLALVGFTRFEAETPNIQGEYEGDVKRAPLALDSEWFPAVENRGEGIFVQLHGAAVKEWRSRPEVAARVRAIAAGHERWRRDRRSSRPFPDGPFVLLHTLSHLLIQSLSTRCGYPASSIRERIYVDDDAGRFGILLYTASPDADGTLGGLVQEARHVQDHLAQALRRGALCSNDPICADHAPGDSLEGRWLHGAACHGCALVAETSCEMRNDYLDRALVVPVLGVPNAAFFEPVG